MLLPRGGYLSSASCLQTGPLWTMSCFAPAFICCSCCLSFRSESGLFHLHITVLAQGRNFTGAHCTILFIQQLNNKGWLDSDSVTRVSFWLVYQWEICFFKKNPLLADVSHLWPCVYQRASIWIPVWVTPRVWGVSVWTYPSMRMFLQHFFTKDPYLWTMLCLCCKLALPTTQLCELISFFLMNHMCKSD